MRGLRRTAPLLAALLFGPSFAGAEALLVGRGPWRRPLFVELYRQSIYAAARYGRGFDVYDAELAPQATAPLTIDFRDEGSSLLIVMSRGGSPVTQGLVDFPPAEWDVSADVERAREFAARLTAALPGEPPAPARIATDLARANLAYQVFDFPSLVWAVNLLGEAQKGRAADPGALRLMSSAYAWLGYWLEDVPSDRAKLFQARALALAGSAEGAPGGSSGQLALALALCGRPGDALLQLQRSPPEPSETAELALSIARDDLRAAVARAKDSRPWLWASAVDAMHLDLDRVSRPVLRELARGAPADPAAMHFLSGIADVSENGPLTQHYAGLPFRLYEEGGFLAGRRFNADWKPDPAARRLGYRELVDALRRDAPGDPGEELPRSARGAVLLDLAVDAELLRVHMMVEEWDVPETGRAEAARARPLVQAHPWGFLIPLIREDLDKDPAAAGELDAGLAGAHLNFGGVAAIERDFRDVYNFQYIPRFAARDGEFDDVAHEDSVRAYERGGPVGIGRVARLDPYSAGPYLWGDEAKVDEGLRLLGDRAALLRRKLIFAERRRPANLDEIGAIADRVLRLDPVDWWVRRTKAALLIARGRPLDAAASWREIVRAEPESVAGANAAAQMSWACLVAGDADRARRVALAAAPAYSKSALLALAHAYEASGRYDLAEPVYMSVDYRYGKRWKQPLLGKFYMRTGDPRGWGLVHAQIPKFFAHQAEQGVVLTDEDHIELLDAFLMTEEWNNAADLLARVLIPRWHPTDARYQLWLAATVMSSEDGSFADAKRDLEASVDMIPANDPLLSVYDVFVGRATIEEARARLDYYPENMSLGAYVLALLYQKVTNEPEKAQEMLKMVVALKRYDSPEYYLASRQLGRVPPYSERFWRQLFAQVKDVKRLGGRAARWWASQNSAKTNGTDPRPSR